MKYSVKWADLRIMWWMKSICSPDSDGTSQWMTGSKNHAVCSDENVSVDRKKIRQAHRTAGHQVRSQVGTSKPPRRGCISGSCGAGRGLRQGCSGTVLALQRSRSATNTVRPALQVHHIYFSCSLGASVMRKGDCCYPIVTIEVAQTLLSVSLDRRQIESVGKGLSRIPMS